MKGRPYRIIFLSAVMIGLVLPAYFMANVELPPWSHAVSAVSVILFAVPTFWAAKMWLGWRDALIVFGALGIFALLIESVAITTGVPYGHFGYSDHLGLKLFGVVPWTVSFAWPPLLLGAYAIAAKLCDRRSGRMAMTTLLLVVFDMVLDPGAVFLGFWKYADGGWFYGVPLSNFAGWIVSGLAGAILLEGLVSRAKPLLPVPIQIASGAFFIVLFWSAFAAFAGLVAPAAIGIAVLMVIMWTWRRSHYSFDDMIVLVDDDNNATGTAAKLPAHNSKTRLHRAFSVFIFNRKGELLLQQRAFSKKTWPGVWSNSCCGHVMLHESTESAAARRLQHELGIGRVDLTMVLPHFRYRAERDGVVENEICPVLVGRYEGRIDLNPAEVASIKWVDWHEFVESTAKPGTELSPWAIGEVRLLAGSGIFREWFARELAHPGSSFVPV
jgi:isopentenyl-diphosphate delta-isomerase type 1